MSRTVRRNLFSILELLEKACQWLEDSLMKRQIEQESIMSLLADAQEGAISIGNTVEALYGEGTDTVKELEQYCETLYQLTLVLDDPLSKKTLFDQMKKQIRRTRRFLGNEVSGRLEVVFLPYKVSMWDSLESVWTAAKAEKSADVYVIPIPYYDKNSDGSFKEEHYEGNLFPDYVEVTHYEDYDFDLRRPDMIFIHNPYDDWNHVTSVHPFFYSSNLKKFTEKLVYIPYYVWNGEGVAEHMAITKGAIYADFIIVQSEKEKEDYIRHFKKHFPNIEIASKLLPLGSPKLDKARSLSKSYAAVPKVWRNRSAGKNVIFYNTSLGTLLKESEVYLNKLEWVFHFFAGRDNTVLLWRPHPLMESTLLSMREELYEKYMELKNWFLNEEIGIYDDTPDMYPAIALSDAYYGDWSSVVWVYKETGKPVMIQNMEIW